MDIILTGNDIDRKRTIFGRIQAEAERIASEAGVKVHAIEHGFTADGKLIYALVWKKSTRDAELIDWFLRKMATGELVENINSAINKLVFAI